MTASFNAVSVAIGDLIKHPANVRSKSPEEYTSEAIADVRASIATLGLIQPLLVQELDGKYAVLAGGRRHAALNELVQDKSAKGFTAKTKVDCRLVPSDCDVTTALSLAENVTQAPMSAIDEFEAFAQMMKVDGQTPDTIAKTFGTTVAAVKDRLRYGLVHPDIRAAVRAKSITLDTMKAFANHPSQDVQLEVFNALTKDNETPRAYEVRQALSSRGVKVSDTLGAFVLDEYKARNGAIAADLLEEHSVLEDPELVKTILLEKLTADAEQVRANHGFAWADAMERYDWSAMSDFGRVYPSQVELSEDDQKRVDEISAEIEAIYVRLEPDDLDHEETQALYDEVDDLEAEARNLQEGYSQEDLARAGVIASWTGQGISLQIGLVRPEDKAKATSTSAGNQPGDPDAMSDEIQYSVSLADDLKTERAMALGAAMTNHPEATLDLTLFKLVSDVLTSGMSVTHAIKVNAGKEYRNHAKMDEIDATSLEQVAAAHDALDLTWLDETRSPADQFAAFRVLPADEKAKLVAYATASTTQSSFARSSQQDSLMHDFEREIMPDVRAHWTPNAALFNRFKKAWLLKIIGEDLGLTQEAVALASSTKKEIVKFCDQLFAEPFATLTEAQRAAVEAWCPPLMQTMGTVEDDAEHDDVAVAA